MHVHGKFWGVMPNRVKFNSVLENNLREVRGILVQRHVESTGSAGVFSAALPMNCCISSVQTEVQTLFLGHNCVASLPFWQMGRGQSVAFGPRRAFFLIIERNYFCPLDCKWLTMARIMSTAPTGHYTFNFQIGFAQQRQEIFGHLNIEKFLFFISTK